MYYLIGTRTVTTATLIMDASSFQHVDQPQPNSNYLLYVNHDIIHKHKRQSSEKADDDKLSRTFAAKSRTFINNLCTSGTLCILCIIFIVCGIAMVMIGISLWSGEHHFHGVALAGFVLSIIGALIGLGAVFVRRRVKQSHRLPVVSISLNHRVDRCRSVIGEYNTAVTMLDGERDHCGREERGNSPGSPHNYYSPAPHFAPKYNNDERQS